MENTPKGTMFAGTDLIVQFMNPESMNILKRLEEHLPVKPENIIGQSIDIFHKDPQHQRNIVSNPKNLPVKTLITVGPESVSLDISAVIDQNQNYLGPMISWEIVTEKVKSDQQMAQIVGLVENNPVNMMYADKELNLAYLNPAGQEVLRNIEGAIGVKVEDMVGKSIDVFHKNPAAARKILSDPKNLPHRAQIVVGEANLDLLVSALYDHDQNYLGPMVTWEDITEKLRNERESQELVARDQKQA
ncbi:MAG: chemotaxis protein, partial [Nitrospina sp.]|nr:chemotaxis protein [Nitrospina sp.]